MSSENQSQPGHWQMRKAVVVGWAVCSALLLGLNGALVWQNREMKLAGSRQAEEQQQKATAGKTVSEVPAGTVIETLRGKDVSGKELVVENGQPTLFLVFSPACGFCKKNWPQWNRLVDGLAAKGVRTVAIDTTSSVTPEYVSLYKFTDAVVLTGLPKEETKKYRMRFTPVTILTGRGGVVERSWAGMLDDKVLGEFQAAIDKVAQS